MRSRDVATTAYKAMNAKQASAARFASSFAPGTALGITFRNVVTNLMRVPFIAEYFVGRDLRDDIELPHYDFAPQ